MHLPLKKNRQKNANVRDRSDKKKTHTHTIRENHCNMHSESNVHSSTFRLYHEIIENYCFGIGNSYIIMYGCRYDNVHHRKYVSLGIFEYDSNPVRMLEDMRIIESKYMYELGIPNPFPSWEVVCLLEKVPLYIYSPSYKRRFFTNLSFLIYLLSSIEEIPIMVF